MLDSTYAEGYKYSQEIFEYAFVACETSGYDTEKAWNERFLSIVKDQTLFIRSNILKDNLNLPLDTKWYRIN